MAFAPEMTEATAKKVGNPRKPLEHLGGLFGGGTTGHQGLIAGLTRNLRWLFFVLLAVIALILLIRLLPKR